LFRLSNSEGNPVDDVELIKALEASKLKSQEITAKVKSAEQTEKDIDVTRSQYIPVAVRTQILFFCTTDLVSVCLYTSLAFVLWYLFTVKSGMLSLF